MKSRRRPHILLIDDDRLTRELLNSFLSENYDVTTFESAENALPFFDPKIIDLVLCDIYLTGMSGIEFRKKLFETGGDLVPFLLMTGRGSKELETASANLGIDDYLIKPIERVHLGIVIERILKRHGQIRDGVSKRLDAQVTHSLQPSVPTRVGPLRATLRHREATAGGGDVVLHHCRSPQNDILILADIMGHGFESKFFAHAYTGYLYGLLRSTEGTNNPAQILSRLNETIIDDHFLKQSLLTLQVLSVDANGLIRLDNAGHPRPILADPEGARFIGDTNIIAGLIPNPKDGQELFPQISLQLNENQRLFLYTDGVMDASSHSEDRAQMEAATLEILSQTEFVPLEVLADQIYAKHKCIYGEAIADDLTFILLERRA